MTAIAAGGDGVGRLGDGRVVFIEGALPGERVGVEITEIRRDYARARLETVLEPSAARVPPPCPARIQGCGGCSWQHVAAEAQLVLKASIVADALRRIADVPDWPIEIPRPQPAVGRRTTVHVGVDAAGRACFRKRKAHELIAVEGCSVAHPRLEELIVEGRFPAAESLLLRVGARTGDRIAFPRWRKGPRSAPRLPVDVLLARGPGVWIHEVVGGSRWRVSAGSFFQPGPEVAERLVDAVDRAVGHDLADGDSLVDAYAGVGLLGGSLVRRRPGIRLTAIESNRWAVGDARANLAGLGARVVHAAVAESRRWMPAIVPLVPRVIVADPARPGLGRSAAQALGRIGAPVFVLVSCDPASMARDVGLLRNCGYGLKRLELLDVFPDTAHVETVARFELDAAP